LQAKDLLVAYMHERTPELKKLVREAPIIPSSADARDVLAMLKSAPVHIGLVHDEYGAFEGIVTAADILESIVGAFHSEQGPPEPAVVRRADGSLLISGWMPVDELGDLLGVRLPPHHRIHTVAGLVLQHFNELPQVGDAFTLGRLEHRGSRSRRPPHRQDIGEPAKAGFLTSRTGARSQGGQSDYIRRSSTSEGGSVPTNHDDTLWIDGGHGADAPLPTLRSCHPTGWKVSARAIRQAST
jgi:CBS domain-containing protein